MPRASQVLSEPPVPNLLRANLERIRERIARGCAAAGRAPSEVCLVAVTKTVSLGPALALARLGQLDLGENRVDELARKVQGFAEAGVEARWHMLGHLQRNKARRALEHASTVHSVDTPRLLETLSRLGAELGRNTEVFLEVRAIDSAERTGFAAGELPGAAELAARLPHLRLRGLMVMAAPDPAARVGELASQARARATFAAVRALGERLPPALFASGRVEYSMGMSSDLEAAVAEGAHLVRIGTALFEGLQREEPA